MSSRTAKIVLDQVAPALGERIVLQGVSLTLFVNGLPLVVVECKDANVYTANPMHEAFRQLLRYSNQRAETKQARLREGEPRLFSTNPLLIRTRGEQAEFGTITSTAELNLSGAGEKVKQLIDEHLISLGINAKIPGSA